MGGQPSKIPVDIKLREHKLIKVNIPYGQLNMIRVLQKSFDFEVKGTIYVDHELNFKSFEVRTDNSEIYSYGASDWRISFHTHPDNTAQKYGVRYFSPPSTDDIMEIYDHCQRYMPVSTNEGFGEISIIFCNEGIYVLQADRGRFRAFNSESLPLDGLEAILEGTFSEFTVDRLKQGIIGVLGTAYNIDNPDLSVEQFTSIVKDVCANISENYGLVAEFYGWKELESAGLTLNIYDYLLKKVSD